MPNHPTTRPAPADADQRVAHAREFLDAIRPYKVADRPHSVLMREDADLRRFVGQLLDVISEQARPGSVRIDVGGWISGPSLPPGTTPARAMVLTAAAARPLPPAPAPRALDTLPRSTP